MLDSEGSPTLSPRGYADGLMPLQEGVSVDGRTDWPRAAGNSNLPAMAGVVGFKIRLILLAELKT